MNAATNAAPYARRPDLDAIRETVESGEVTKHRAEDQLLELCDEIDRLKREHAAELAAARKAHADEVAEIIAEYNETLYQLEADAKDAR